MENIQKNVFSDRIYGSPEKLFSLESGFVPLRIVRKPWGEEHLLAITPRFCLKKLIINPGERLSLQYHERKWEALFCMSGEGIVFLGSHRDKVEQFAFRRGEVVNIVPGTIHTYEAIGDAPLCLFEASTPEVDDVVRLSDQYGRA